VKAVELVAELDILKAERLVDYLENSMAEETASQKVAK